MTFGVVWSFYRHSWPWKSCGLQRLWQQLRNGNLLSGGRVAAREQANDKLPTGAVGEQWQLLQCWIQPKQHLEIKDGITRQMTRLRYRCIRPAKNVGKSQLQYLSDPFYPAAYLRMSWSLLILSTILLSLPERARDYLIAISRSKGHFTLKAHRFSSSSWWMLDLTVTTKSIKCSRDEDAWRPSAWVARSTWNVIHSEQKSKISQKGDCARDEKESKASTWRFHSSYEVRWRDGCFTVLISQIRVLTCC